MTADIFDFATRKKISTDKPVEVQQEEFNQAAYIEALTEVMEMSKEHYDTDRALLIAPSRDANNGPMVISMKAEASLGDCHRILRGALKTIIRAGKEQEYDFDA